MSFLQLVLLLDKTIEGINSILPIVSYRNNNWVLVLNGLVVSGTSLYFSSPYISYHGKNMNTKQLKNQMDRYAPLLV